MNLGLQSIAADYASSIADGFRAWTIAALSTIVIIAGRSEPARSLIPNAATMLGTYCGSGMEAVMIQSAYSKSILSNICKHKLYYEIHVKRTRSMKDILVNLLLSLVNFLLQREPKSEILPLSTYQNETLPQPICPKCSSSHTVKNGSIHNGKKKYKCEGCGYQFMENPTNITISPATKQFIDKLFLERIALRGIARVTGVSWSWLQNYVNQKLGRIPRKIKVSGKSKGRLTIECEEMWSFVAAKQNAFSIWLAIDRDTRAIVGCYVGDRTRQSARKLWESLPGSYRQCAVAYTDCWQSYQTVIPHKRHRAVGKETG